MSLVIGSKDKYSFPVTHHYPSQKHPKVRANDKPSFYPYRQHG
jgi:hypothetical protein